jgi:hypothetical protein
MESVKMGKSAMTRFNHTEAKMYAALSLVRSEGFGARQFMTFEGMTPERAEELDSYKDDMTNEEVALIVDCLPPIPGLSRLFEKKCH